MTEYLYAGVDFDFIDNTVHKVTCEAHKNGFEVTGVDTRDDWVTPGVFIVRVYMERKDLDLWHDYTFRSNGARVTGNPTNSMRTKVRNRYRQLVRKMERRLNRTTPNAEGTTMETPND